MMGTNMLKEVGSGKYFDLIDDLLDFRNDDVGDGFSDCEAVDFDAFPPVWLEGSDELSSAGRSNTNSDPSPAHPTARYEDIVQLEWLSNFVQDSLCKAKTLPICHAKRARSKRPRPSTFNPRSAIHLISPRYFPDSLPLKKRLEPRKKIRFLHGQCPSRNEDPDANPLRKCTHCETRETPQWRGGPNGPKTLCNACGVRYSLGRLFPEYRPIASPTFVPSLHSNRHIKVVKMRKNKNEEETIQPELLPKYEDIVQLECLSNSVQDSLSKPKTLTICDAKCGRSKRPPARYSPDSLPLRKRLEPTEKKQKTRLLPGQRPSQNEDPNANPLRKCTHCEITRTPQWIAGPNGPTTLCNSCGFCYKSGRLFPEYWPAASPTEPNTYVPSLHSSSHKEVVEVRICKNEEETFHPDLFQPSSHHCIQNPATFNPRASIHLIPPRYFPDSLPLKRKKKQFLPVQCPSQNVNPDANPLRKCSHCETTKTALWRVGPNGLNTLCNACGVRYRTGRLFPEYRPAASPTFVPSLHSNSHKEVLEMRKSKNKEETYTT